MIRQAIRRDAAEAVPLIWQAIGDVAFVLTGTPDVQETTSILSDFFQQEDNRLSYQNALVMEEEGQLVGLVLLYDGAKARELDLPLERAAAVRSGDFNYRIGLGVDRVRQLVKIGDLESLYENDQVRDSYLKMLHSLTRHS